MCGGVAALGHGPWVAATAAALILPVLALVFVRVRGRWLVELLVLRWRFRRRAASRRVRPEDPRLAVLGSLTRDLTVRTVEDRGRSIGVGRDGSGWFAGVALVPPAGVRGDVRPPLRLGPLIAAVGDSDAPVSSAQLVVHTVPVRTEDDGRPATVSYANLGAGLSGPPPVERTSWITVRVDPTTAADLAAPRFDVDALYGGITAAVHRISRATDRAGLSHQILDGQGLISALLRSCGTDTALADGATAGGGERWDSCRTAGLAHACFWVRSVPATDRLGVLIDALARVPATLTSVSLSVEPVLADRSELSLRLLVRVAAEPRALAGTCRFLDGVAARHGAALARLDGEHEPATYATAPTGGVPQ